LRQLRRLLLAPQAGATKLNLDPYPLAPKQRFASN